MNYKLKFSLSFKKLAELHFVREFEMGNSFTLGLVIYGYNDCKNNDNTHSREYYMISLIP